MTLLLRCRCVSGWQDGAYGKGMRVHNACAKLNPGSTQMYRCTVCQDKKAAAEG